MRFFFFLSLAACGGAIDTTLLDGGDASTSDAASQSDAATCNDLFNQLTAETPTAEQCCPTCNIVQCTAQVDGLCCPITVNASGSDAVKAHEATLAQIKSAHCDYDCPAIACSTKPSGNCTSGGTCAP